MIFHDFVFLILIPFVILAGIYANKKAKSASVKFSSQELFVNIKPSFKVILSQNLYFVRILALVLVVIALSRPQIPLANSKVETEGIDIVLAVDSSTSMLAEDFKIVNKRLSRIDVVKDVVKDFIKARSNDRIGLIVFAARAYTASPLTLDHGWLIDNLERVQSGMVEDGTAIGSGIAASLNRLRESKAKSKIIILLTDGRNNTGNISPLTATEAARALKIKIYTIGAGSKGLVPYPARDFFGNKVYQQIQVDIDEETLAKIAESTNAKYFRATDTESLRNIYSEIDKMEKTKIEEKGYQEFNELFSWFLSAAVLFLLLEVVLNNTYLRRLP